MPMHLPTRWAALAAVCLGVAGCGRPSRQPAEQAEHQPQAGAPRPLATPADARPLAAAVKWQSPPHPASTASSTAGPRIVELSVTPEDLARKTIRQPGRVTIREPASSTAAAPVREPIAVPPPPAIAAAPLRSPYIPFTAPQPAESPEAAPLPQLPAAPTFDVAGHPPPSAQSGPYEIVPALPAPAQRQFVPPQPPVAAQPPPAADFAAQQTAPPNGPPPVARRSDPLQAVVAQAQAISDRGLAMAQRGMLFAGREETIKALQLIAQALDVQQGGTAHAAALAAGLTALEEARDFAAASQRPGAVVDVAAVAQAHRTPLLEHEAPAGLSPVVAQQQYLGHAQAQLVIAAGGQPAASQVLYRLGRLQTALAAHDASPQTLHAPQAIVCHQAALAIDGHNYLAANELGVLLARYGQLERARDLLARSVAIRPQVESWHNLAVIHRRLGETDLARRADRERTLLAQQSSGRVAPASLVQWVDTRTFSTAGGDVSWPESKRGTTAAAGAPGKRR